jgi:threonine dehydrogenase-like Zn-dependent dehydrogenase
VTACAICGSDLDIYGGIIADMKKGDVLGHENMGEVVEVGSDNKKLKVGDRVVVPFTISCGECFFCRNGFYSGCERTNPDHEKAAKLWGNSPAGLFGYSHLLGGYAGGQAEYLRVPYGLPFEYSSRPGWETYADLLRLARVVRKNVRDLHPRDMIDLQSFVWVQGSDEYPNRR